MGIKGFLESVDALDMRQTQVISISDRILMEAFRSMPLWEPLDLKRGLILLQAQK